MNWLSFSVILHSPATLCSSVCPECYCLSAAGFINNENVIFSVSFLPHFLSSTPFFFSSLHFSCQPFMSPRYPGGPRPSLRMPNQVLITYSFYADYDNSVICVATSLASILISFHALVLSQPPGGIPGSQPLLPNSLDPTRPQGRTGTAVVVTGLSCDAISWNMLILYSRTSEINVWNK